MREEEEPWLVLSALSESGPGTGRRKLEGRERILLRAIL